MVLAAVLLLAALPAAAVVLTGEVRTAAAQDLFVPPSNSSPVVLHFFVPDGTVVHKGDPVLGIDPGGAASQVRDVEQKIMQTAKTAEKDLAALQLKVVDAELALADAQAARDTAAVDAGIPKQLLSALDYDRYQGTFESAKRQLDLAKTQLATARAAVERQRKDGALQVQKLRTQLAYLQTQVDAATVVADRDGIVVHGFQGRSPWGSGGRFRQGSTVFPGSVVGQVVSAGEHRVRAWALQADRDALKVGQSVRLHFDALPQAHVSGTIESISGGAEPKTEWGEGRYYQVDIALAEGAGELPLLPGMSVRVQTDDKAAAAASPPAPAAADTPIEATGTIAAQRSVAIMPPQVQGLWQLNVTSMAPDAAPVKKGQPVVVFAAGSLAQELPSTRSELAEKQRTLDQLRLKLADDKRSATLATAQARADAEKAARKAQQPQEYVPGIDYKKLVIDRKRTAQRLKLTLKRETIAARSRAAQLALAQAEVEQLQAKLARDQKALASLTVRAPAAGIFLHNVLPSGDKVDTGSQVWRGMRVGDIPDMSSLAVRAELPERELRRVHEGDAVRVILAGGASRTLAGTLADVGGGVHSKSSAEPVPVVDLLITFNAPVDGLKPGQPVRVEITPAAEAPATDAPASEAAP